MNVFIVLYRSVTELFAVRYLAEKEVNLVEALNLSGFFFSAQCNILMSKIRNENDCIYSKLLSM